RHLGWRVRSSSRLPAQTDVMETWTDFRRQRLRWQRGSLETLGRYGLTRFTWSLWFAQCRVYGATLVYGLTLWMLAVIGVYGASLSVWLLVLPLVALCQVVEAWRAGPRARLAAALIVPIWCYDVLRVVVYWWALGQILTRRQ